MQITITVQVDPTKSHGWAAHGWHIGMLGENLGRQLMACNEVEQVEVRDPLDLNRLLYKWGD